MKLLYTKRSPYARKVRIMAAEKRIALDLIDEDLQHKSERLLKANPLGKVPTLILDDGTTIFDSRVICQYLDALDDKTMLIPGNPVDRVEVLKWEAFADDLMTAAIYLYMEKVRHPHDFHQQFVTTQEGNISLAYAHIEKNLGPLKKNFDLAAIAVVSALGYGQFRLPHMTLPEGVSRWVNELSKRPSVAQTIPVA